MTFVFIILAIIVFFSWAKNDEKRRTKENADSVAILRKTDAYLEVYTVDKYMKEGKSFEEAFVLAQKDIIRQGYDPCFPREAYLMGCSQTKNPFGYNRESSILKDGAFEKYQSEAVKNRWDIIKAEKKIFPPDDEWWKKMGNDKERVYRDFPKTIWDYRRDVRAYTLRIKILPVGTYITLPIHGTCEIIAIDLQYTYASYTLKVLKSGTILKRIDVENKDIRRL